MSNRLHMLRQIDVFSLHLFVSAVEEGQIGLAAAREHIAASTATKRIQALEDIVGIPLLNRSRSGVVPTEAGELVVRHARSIIGEVDELRSALTNLIERVDDELSVAAAHSTIADLIAPTVGTFAVQRPLTALALREVDNSDVVPMVESGQCDIGVFASVGAPVHGKTTSRRLFSEPLVAVLPRQHPLARSERVAFRDLADAGLIATYTTAPVFERVAADAGHAVELRHVVRTGEVALGMVRAGLGVTIVPPKITTDAADDEMTVCDIADEWAVRQVNVVYPADRPLPSSAEAFLGCLVAETAGRR